MPEISKHCPGVPFLLVGTKSDCRDDAAIAESLGKCSTSRNENAPDYITSCSYPSASKNQNMVSSAEAFAMASSVSVEQSEDCIVTSNQSGESSKVPRVLSEDQGRSEGCV